MDEIEKAIEVFYHSSNSYQRQEAHKWLLQLQRSSEGWQTSWTLLSHEKKVETQYYGAIILHSKISNDFAELPVGQINELKEKLLEVCANYVGSSKFVLSKLCACYACLIIMTADGEFNLSDYFGYIDSYIKTLNADSKFLILELLTVLPIQFRNLQISSTQKIISRTCISQFIPNFISICKTILQLEETPNDQIVLNYQNNLLSCLLGWIEFGIPLTDSSQLIPLIIPKLFIPILSDKSFEVLIEIVTSPSSYSCQVTMFNILQQILQLEPVILKTIDSEDDDMIRNFCLFLTGIGETHTNIFIKTTDPNIQHSFFSLVSLILKFTSIKGCFPVDETSSELTLNFWFTLQDCLYSIDCDSITAYQQQLYQAYDMLLHIFSIKCQYPADDVLASISTDDAELLRCYRIDIQDAMLYVYTLMQGKCLAFFSDKLQQLLLDEKSSWQSYEACLHLLKGLAETIDTDENVYFPKILTLLNSIPKHDKILNSLVLFLGSLSDWLNYHPEQINVVLPFLIEGLSTTNTQTSCSISLKEICVECASMLDVKIVSVIVSACIKCIKMQSTSLNVVVRLYSICGSVITSIPLHEMDSYLVNTIKPLYEWLKHSIDNTVDRSSKKRIVHYLNCYRAFFQSIEQHEKCPSMSGVYKQIIPLLQVLNIWCTNEEVVSAVTTCVSKALQILQKHEQECVIATAELLLDYFCKFPYGCILNTASVLITLFGTSESLSPKIEQFFQMLCTKCFELIQSEGSKEHPDCMESFMELLARVTKTVPAYMFNNTEFTVSTIKSSLVLLNYQETPTIKNTCNFLIAFINQSKSFQNNRIIELMGRDILIQCLLCIGGVSPRHTIDHFAECILSLNKYNVTYLATWLNELFAKDGFPTTTATAIQKETFKKLVLREKTNKRRIKEIVKEFALACRGLLGMPHT